MNLDQYKIPIIAGRNDTPTTTESQLNHPNGSFVVNKINSLIDALILELNGLDLSNLNSDDITEGSSNLYYTEGRVDSVLNTKTTDDFDEGSINKYFSNKTTDDLPEGNNNAYYTETRVNTNFANKTTDDLTEGNNNLYAGNILLERISTNTTITEAYKNKLLLVEEEVTLTLDSLITSTPFKLYVQSDTLETVTFAGLTYSSTMILDTLYSGVTLFWDGTDWRAF